MQLHSTLIAGSVPRASRNPAAAAHLAAQVALDTERLHVLTSMTDSVVFYFAAPSRELTSGATSTPLAAALPSHPAHRGDGCYIHYLGSDAALVVKDGDTISAMFNDREAIQSAIESHDLPVYDVAELAAQPWALETQAGILKKAGDIWAHRIQIVASVWAAVAALAGAGFLIASGMNDKTSEVHARQSKELVARVQLSQPVFKDLADLNQVNAVLLKAGGWLATYKLDGGQVTYSARLPAWVSKKTIDELGPQIYSEYDEKEENIFVSQGNVKKPSDSKK